MEEEKPVDEHVKKPAEKKATPKKTATKRKPEAEEKVVDIADFFTTTREKDGVWYELRISDIGIEVEALMYGPASEQAKLARAEYDEALKKAEDIKDEKEKADAKERLLVEWAVGILGGLRGKNGIKITNNGKELVDFKKAARSLFYENADIRNDFLAASLMSVTFMR